MPTGERAATSFTQSRPGLVNQSSFLVIPIISPNRHRLGSNLRKQGSRAWPDGCHALRVCGLPWSPIISNIRIPFNQASPCFCHYTRVPKSFTLLSRHHIVSCLTAHETSMLSKHEQSWEKRDGLRRAERRARARALYSSKIGVDGSSSSARAHTHALACAKGRPRACLVTCCTPLCVLLSSHCPRKTGGFLHACMREPHCFQGPAKRSGSVCILDLSVRAALRSRSWPGPQPSQVVVDRREGRPICPELNLAGRVQPTCTRRRLKEAPSAQPTCTPSSPQRSPIRITKTLNP